MRFEARTSGAGFYEIQGIPPGLVRVVGAAELPEEGFLCRTVDVRLAESEDAVVNVELIEGGQRIVGNVEGGEASSIGVVVITEGKEAIPPVQILELDNTVPPGVCLVQLVRFALNARISEYDGSFSSEALPPGDYTVTAYMLIEPVGDHMQNVICRSQTVRVQDQDVEVSFNLDAD